MAKLMQKFAVLTHAIETDSSQLAFCFCGLLGKQQKGYLNCMKSKHTDWNINILFIIHVDFDHAWVEHYPVAEI